MQDQILHFLMELVEKYYSFRIGNYSQNQKDWILRDLKIPAYDIKEATIIFMWHQDYYMRLNNQWNKRKKEFLFPGPEYIHMIIRQAIEYKIARKSGFFLVQYKKQRFYSSWEILTYFKK